MLGLQQAQTGMNPFSGGGNMGMGAMTGGFGGFGGGDINSLGPLMGLGQQNQQMGSMMDQMMTMMGMIMQMTMMQQMMSSLANFGGGSGSSGGSGSGIGGFLGGDTSGGTSGATQAAGATDASGGGGGGNAADIAKQYLGQKSGNINGMANFTHAGGMDNNCADFVSACLANAGTYKKKPGDASVRVLKQHLQEDGWKKVSKAQTKPGDVAIFNGTQHVELVSKAGGAELIGSNNKGGGNVQTVSTDSGSWGSIEYFAK